MEITKSPPEPRVSGTVRPQVEAEQKVSATSPQAAQRAEQPQEPSTAAPPSPQKVAPRPGSTVEVVA